MDKMQLFESKQIRSHWDDENELWYFSVVDVVEVLTQSISPRKYWNKLKQRLKEEGNETATNCQQLKMKASDGKMRLTDVADTEQLLRLVQSIPSPQAEPFKLWLAKIGYERLEAMQDPELEPTQWLYLNMRWFATPIVSITIIGGALNCVYGKVKIIYRGLLLICFLFLLYFQ